MSSLWQLLLRRFAPNPIGDFTLMRQFTEQRGTVKTVKSFAKNRSLLCLIHLIRYFDNFTRLTFVKTPTLHINAIKAINLLQQLVFLLTVWSN